MDFLITELTPEQRTQLQVSERAMLALRTSMTAAKRNCFYWDWSTSGLQPCLVSVGKPIETTLLPSAGRDLEMIRTSQRQRFDSARHTLHQAMTDHDQAVDANQQLQLGNAEPMAVAILNALQEVDVLKFHRVIGTHALFAYESAAGVSFDSSSTATQDIDLLWNRQSKIEFRTAMNLYQSEISMIEVLRKADPTFRRNEENKESAVNDDSFAVDFLREDDNPKPELKDRQVVSMSDADQDILPVVAQDSEKFMQGQIFEKVVISYRGDMALMPTVDPVIFAHFKQGMSKSASRDTMKTLRDATQAEAVVHLLNRGLLKSALSPEASRAYQVEGLKIPA